jgi:hypothetical protein
MSPWIEACYTNVDNQENDPIAEFCTPKTMHSTPLCCSVLLVLTKWALLHTMKTNIIFRYEHLTKNRDPEARKPQSDVASNFDKFIA